MGERSPQGGSSACPTDLACSVASLEWRFMNIAAISGLFAVAGAVVGWSLNQIGLRLARRTEQRESDVRDADHRVFVAATAATRFGEAVRWLVEIDWGKNVSGGGPSHATYEQMVVEAQSELRRLREALLGITVKGPNGSALELENCCQRARTVGRDAGGRTRVDRRRAATLAAGLRLIGGCGAVLGSATLQPPASANPVAVWRLVSALRKCIGEC